MLIPMVLAVEVLINHKVKIFLNFQLPECARMKNLLLKILVYTFSLIALILWRMSLVDFTPPTFQKGDNPFAFVQPTSLRMLNLSHLFVINSWILLVPDWLCFDWAFHCIQPIQSFLDPRIMAILLFYMAILSIGFVCLKRNDSKVLLFFSFAILPFLPASNIIVTVGFVIAERNLYLCVFGYSALVVAGFQRLTRKYKSFKQFFKIVALFLLAMFGAKTWIRSIDWQNEHRLYTSGLRVCPDNAKIYYNLAKLAADNATKLSKPASTFERSTAVHLYRHALKLWPDYEHAMNNLGNLYRQEGKNFEAKELFIRALEVQPKFPAAWMNLGVVQANLNELENAKESYKMALRQRKVYPDCHYNLGTLYLKTGEFEKARHHFSHAIQLRPNHFPSWSNLIILLDNLEQFEEAETRAKEAINIFPEKSDFYFHLANIFGKRDRFAEAEAMYLNAITMDNRKSIYFVNLGVLYHRWKRFDEAGKAYEAALNLDPQNQSARANLKKLIGRKK